MRSDAKAVPAWSASAVSGSALCFWLSVDKAELEGEHQLDHTPIGNPGDHSRTEFLWLYLYLASMAVFLTWLIVYGVNV